MKCVQTSDMFLKPEGAIFCHPVEDEFRTPVPLLPESEPHRWHIFLTDEPVTLPEGVKLDYRKTNTNECREEREQSLKKFFAALEKGDVEHVAFVQDISRSALERDTVNEERE